MRVSQVEPKNRHGTTSQGPIDRVRRTALQAEQRIRSTGPCEGFGIQIYLLND
jgi:hypothetical protein